jgi:hypothetical protein
LPRSKSRVQIPFPAPPSAAWPSGKATACKAVILRFESGSRLHNKIKGLGINLSPFFYVPKKQHPTPYPTNGNTLQATPRNIFLTLLPPRVWIRGSWLVPVFRSSRLCHSCYLLQPLSVPLLTDPRIKAPTGPRGSLTGPLCGGCQFGIISN